MSYGAEIALERVDIFDEAGGANRVATLSYALELSQPTAIELTLTPVKGKALICGAVLEPVYRPGVHDVDSK